MRLTLLLVADRGGARFYELAGFRDAPRLTEKIERPEGRLRSGELKSDRHGARGLEGGSKMPHPFGQHEAPTETGAKVFARELAARLDEAVRLDQYDEIMIAAEPHFLGLITAELGPKAAGRVSRLVGKDLRYESDHEIARRFEELRRPGASSPE